MPRRNPIRHINAGSGGILAGLQNQLHAEWAQWVELQAYHEQGNANDKAANRRGRNRKTR